MTKKDNFDGVLNGFVVLLAIILVVLIGVDNANNKLSPEEKLVSKIKFEFEELEYVCSTGFGKDSPRTYEAIVNKMMEKFSDDLKFYNFELINLEVDGVKSGVIAEYSKDKFLVITNELVPGAIYSGPAALFFTESRPQTIK